MVQGPRIEPDPHYYWNLGGRQGHAHRLYDAGGISVMVVSVHCVCVTADVNVCLYKSVCKCALRVFWVCMQHWAELPFRPCTLVQPALHALPLFLSSWSPPVTPEGPAGGSQVWPLLSPPSPRPQSHWQQMLPRVVALQEIAP